MALWILKASDLVRVTFIVRRVLGRGQLINKPRNGLRRKILRKVWFQENSRVPWRRSLLKPSALIFKKMANLTLECCSPVADEKLFVGCPQNKHEPGRHSFHAFRRRKQNRSPHINGPGTFILCFVILCWRMGNSLGFRSRDLTTYITWKSRVESKLGWRIIISKIPNFLIFSSLDEDETPFGWYEFPIEIVLKVPMNYQLDVGALVHFYCRSFLTSNLLIWSFVPKSVGCGAVLLLIIYFRRNSPLAKTNGG